MKIDRRTVLGGLGSSVALPVILAPETAEARRALTLVKRVRLGGGALGNANNPSLTILTDGTLMAGWLSQPMPGTSYAYVRFFNGDGVPISGNIKLQGGTTAGIGAESIQVIATGGGTAVAVFTAKTTGATGQDVTDVYLQRFSAAHAAIGAPIRVNTSLPYMQMLVMAARLTNGNVMVTWTTGGATADATDLVGRVIAPNGTMVTGEKVLTSTVAGVQVSSSFAAINNSRSVIVYWTFTDVSQPMRFYAQTLNASGDRVGAPLLIKSVSSTASPYGAVGAFYLPALGVVYTWFKKAPRPTGAPAGTYARIVWRSGDDTHETTPVFPFDADQTSFFPAVTTTPNGNLFFTVRANGTNAASTRANEEDTKVIFGVVLIILTGIPKAGPQELKRAPDITQPVNPDNTNNLYGDYFYCASTFDPSTVTDTAYWERYSFYGNN